MSVSDAAAAAAAEPVAELGLCASGLFLDLFVKRALIELK